MRKRTAQDFGVLEILGMDARRFLQAQLATDVRAWTPTQAGWAALLSAQGRVWAAGLLVCESEARWLWMLDGEVLDLTLPHLRKFVLRSKVQLQRAEGALAWTPAHGWRDPAGRCWTLEAPPSGTELRPEDAARLAIDAGVLDFGIEHHDRHLAQVLGMHRLTAVALDKGCYPGQEIVARTHYLGRIKRGLARYTAPAELSTTTLIDRHGQTRGEVLNQWPTAGGVHGLLVHDTATTELEAQDATGANVALRITPFP